jgi:hypothetical protein
MLLFSYKIYVFNDKKKPFPLGEGKSTNTNQYGDVMKDSIEKSDERKKIKVTEEPVCVIVKTIEANKTEIMRGWQEEIDEKILSFVDRRVLEVECTEAFEALSYTVCNINKKAKILGKDLNNIEKKIMVLSKKLNNDVTQEMNKLRVLIHTLSASKYEKMVLLQNYMDEIISIEDNNAMIFINKTEFGKYISYYDLTIEVVRKNFNKEVFL